MSKKLPVSGFRWVENTFQSSKDFIENTLKLETKDIFLKLMFKKRKITLKSYMVFTMTYSFCLKN